MTLDIEYEIFEDDIPGFLLGAAIYSADRKSYVFGPNTHLEKVSVPSKKGRHHVRYSLPKLPLIKGIFTIDVGIFNNDGIVNLDYKSDIAAFSVSNKYFSEGLVYLEHKWDVIS